MFSLFLEVFAGEVLILVTVWKRLCRREVWLPTSRCLVLKCPVSQHVTHALEAVVGLWRARILWGPPEQALLDFGRKERNPHPLPPIPNPAEQSRVTFYNHQAHVETIAFY